MKIDGIDEALNFIIEQEEVILSYHLLQEVDEDGGHAVVGCIESYEDLFAFNAIRIVTNVARYNLFQQSDNSWTLKEV